MALEPKTEEPKTEEQALDVLPRRFGQYQLFDHIGRGGMANIYLARLETQLGGDRLVVVKLIHDAFSKDPQFATQFIDEAKLCAGLRHGNIAQVVDLGRSPVENQLYMAMEYVEGFDLHQLLRKLAQTRIGLPPEFAFHIVREVLAALDFAHRSTNEAGEVMGIVHRDVSPSNVLLSFEGEVKLCDFGIAKAFANVEAPKGDALTDESTEGRERIVGKSAYMSPEQAWGQPLDARSDVFAAGILLWEMCAGRRLYRGTEAEMLELARNANIPRLPERGLPGHETLQALIDRALHSDREMRFASAQEMLEALDSYLVGQRLFSSQLRFAAFLTDHFSADVIMHRRERERAARALAQGPAATFRPLFDPDEADEPTEIASRADMFPPHADTSQKDASSAPESESAETAPSLDDAEASDSIHASATIPLAALSSDAADELLSATNAAMAPSAKRDAEEQGAAEGPRTTEEPLVDATRATPAVPQARSSARSFAWLLVALGLLAVSAAIWWMQR